MYTWVDNGGPTDVFGSGLARWSMQAEGEAFCRRFELANRLWWRMPIAISWMDRAGLFVVRDICRKTEVVNAYDRIVFAKRERIFRYRSGVAVRVNRLAKKYFVDRMQFQAGDVVIDCGANIGELGLFVKSRAADIRVIAVEPSIPEAKACDENLYNGCHKTHRVALWDSEGQRTFYHRNSTGDSSLIYPAVPDDGYACDSVVPAITLDKLIIEQGIKRIKLLKIDGEGAEPEILAGSQNIITRVSYCAIDCGPERGATRAHVIPEVCNFLMSSGFELLDVNLERQIFWLRNRMFNC